MGCTFVIFFSCTSMKDSDLKSAPWYFWSLEKFSSKCELWSCSLQLGVVCSHMSDAGTRWHMLVHAEIWGAHREPAHRMGHRQGEPQTPTAGKNQILFFKCCPGWSVWWRLEKTVQCSLCQLSQEGDKCAVRVLQLYLFAVWWLHDSGSVYEFLLEPDGCKATKRMPATYKCQMFKPLHVNIPRVYSQHCCRAQSHRQAAGLI